MLRLGKRPMAVWLRYCFAVVIFLVALVARYSVLPQEPGYSFIAFYPAVALSALLFGARPGLLILMLSALGADYLFKPPFWSFRLAPDQMLPMAIFCLTGAVVCFLKRQMSRDAQDLRESRGRLQSIFYAHLDPVLIFDAQGVI